MQMEPKEDLANAIADALEIVKNNTTVPDYVYEPSIGWIFYAGKIVEDNAAKAFELFSEMVNSNEPPRQN